MRSLKRVGTVCVLCLSFAAAGCHEHSKQSVATAQAVAKGTKVSAAAERLDGYFGDQFSDAERALASKPPSDPDCPTF
jgi:Flp pilus assembly protein TadD